MKHKQKAFQLLLRISEGVYSHDGYYGDYCTFCGTVTSKHEKDCEVEIAKQLLKSDFSDLYQAHLDSIEQKRIEIENKKEQDRLKAIQDHIRKHVNCTLCGTEVRRVDLAAHSNSKRCKKLQNKTLNAYSQL